MGVRTSPRVNFAESESYRRARSDELSVMRAFASHASHCRQCEKPYLAFKNGTFFCDRGYNYVKDIGSYFFCANARPYSIIDRDSFRQRVQVEIPTEYEAVRSLFTALDAGFNPMPARKPTMPTIIYEDRQSTRRDTDEAHTLQPNSSRAHRNSYYEDKRRRGSTYEHDEARRAHKRYDAEVIIIPEGRRSRRER